jgi:hypothetical protein
VTTVLGIFTALVVVWGASTDRIKFLPACLMARSAAAVNCEETAVDG